MYFIEYLRCTGIESFTIPDGITIKENFLSGCTNLRSIYGKNASSDNRCWIVDGELLIFAPAGLTQYTIPDSVTKIGISAFYGCSSLTNVSIPNSVTSIGRSAFQGCSSLANITIHDGVIEIGNDAFHGCSSLTEVVIPDSVADFGLGVFVNCTSLKKVTLPKNLTMIGDYTFMSCESLTEIIIPERVTEIGLTAFMNCRSLSSINIPEGVTKIGQWAFMQCNALTNVTLPSTLKSIDEGGFGNCWAMTVVYCKAVTPPTLADYAFGDNNLETVFVPVESVDAYKAVEWGKHLWLYHSFIGWDFSANNSTENIEIHYTSTDGNIVKPFNPLNNTSYKSNPFGTPILSNIYENGEGLIVLDGYAATFGNNPFYKCYTLKSIIIPEGIMEIGSSAFYCCIGLLDITIPESVVKIGEYAFKECCNLPSIVIPNGITRIENHTFYDCTSLKEVSIPESITYIGDQAFDRCWNIEAFDCRAIEPPILGSNVFDSDISAIYVPTESVDAYKAADGWKEYESLIQGKDF